MTARPAWVFNLHDETAGIPRQLSEGIRSRVFTGAQAMLSVVRIDPHTAGTIHSHPEEQWGVLLEGEAVRVQDGAEVPVRAGDFWHTPGGVAHGIRTGASPALVLDVFSPSRKEYAVAGQGFGAARVIAAPSPPGEG
jgi:quercetin dioxygenase-like cupin family protein